MKAIDYVDGKSEVSFDFIDHQTSSHIEKQRESLEIDLAIAIQDVLLKWQDKTGLNVSDVIPHITKGYSDNSKTKAVVTDVKVVLDYKL